MTRAMVSVDQTLLEKEENIKDKLGYHIGSVAAQPM